MKISIHESVCDTVLSILDPCVEFFGRFDGVPHKIWTTAHNYARYNGIQSEEPIVEDQRNCFSASYYHDHVNLYFRDITLTSALYEIHKGISKRHNPMIGSAETIVFKRALKAFAAMLPNANLSAELLSIRKDYVTPWHEYRYVMSLVERHSDFYCIQVAVQFGDGTQIVVKQSTPYRVVDMPDKYLKKVQCTAEVDEFSFIYYQTLKRWLKAYSLNPKTACFPRPLLSASDFDGDASEPPTIPDAETGEKPD